MNLDEVTEHGERVIAEVPNWGFYAHLSIYAFASQFVAGKVVLDAGCGTGYGAAYLLKQGARAVYGIDNSAAAIEFCRAYQARGLDFRVADLTALDPLKLPPVDVLFCSNVLEHIWGVDTALTKLAQHLRPNAVAVMAVPPVVDPGMLEGNLENPYHINNLPPQTWLRKFGRFFETVQGYRHWLKAPWLDHNNWPKAMDAPAEKTTIRETDFTFTASTTDELASQTHTITCVVIGQRPRRQTLPACDDGLLPTQWDVNSIEERIRAKYTHTVLAFANQWEGKVIAAIDPRGTCRNLFLVRNQRKSRIPLELWRSPSGFGWPAGVKAVNHLAIEVLPDGQP